MFSKDSEKWTDLKPKKSLINNDKKLEKADGTDGYGDLMGMMKNMYENGDDDMKRMIS